MLKILIPLLYWNRPKMVQNALYSIRDMNYDNWELALIDDGSDPGMEGEPIAREILKDHLHKIRFINAITTMEERIDPQSHIGLYVNYATLMSNADIVVPLCDDDAITPNYFTHINDFFTNHPDEVWGYSHAIAFDPSEQDYRTVPLTPHYSANRHTERINPACQLDCSQVVYRSRCTRKDGIYWPFPQTGCLDSNVYEKLYNKYGPCPFMGCVGQYKGVFWDQMGRRAIGTLCGITKPAVL